MSLQLPCEFSVREILPAVRSIVAQKLIKERNLSEYKAANLMGLTPAAVSNYLKSRRGSNLRSLLEKDEKFMDLVNEVMERILKLKILIFLYIIVFYVLKVKKFLQSMGTL